MFVVSKFGWVGFCRTVLGPAFPQSAISKLHPTLHTRSDHVAFPPHREYSGMPEHTHHPFPEVVTTTAFHWNLGVRSHT